MMMNDIFVNSRQDTFMVVGIIFPFFMFILAIVFILLFRRAKQNVQNRSSDENSSLNRKYNNLTQKKKTKHKCEYNPARVKELNKICPNCHSTIDKHGHTCPVCGSSLNNICPVCGLINHEKSILCQECHSKLPNARRKHKYRDSQIKHGKGEDSWMEF